MKRLMLMLLALPALAQAQTPTSVSLAQAQQYAVEHSFAVRGAQLDAESAARRVKELTAIGLPQVSGSMEYQNFIDIPVQVAPADAFGLPPYLNQFLFDVSQETGVDLNAPQVDPNAVTELQFGTPQNMSAGIQVTQLVFDGSYFVGLQAAKLSATLSQDVITKSEKDTRDEVAEAYYTVLIAERNVEILTDSRELLAESTAETEALVEAGFAEQQDLDQLQLNVADLDTRIAYAQQQVDVAKKLLKFQMGLDLEAPLTLTDKLDNLISEDMSMLSLNFKPESTIEYQLQETVVDLQRLNVKNERMKGYPQIAGFYTYQQNAFRDEFSFLDFDQSWYPTQLWGLQMNVPIFGSFQGKHRIAQADVELRKAQVDLEQVSEGAALENATARNEYAYALSNYQNQSRSVELAQRIFKTTRIKYNEGLATSFELTQADNQLLSAQGNYVSAMLQLLNARTRLARSFNQ
ncbi:MAG: TolC family protein [Flavobacteriales bacterium]